MRTLHLPIADPCHEDWDAMDRVERGRFCQSCVKEVYDLSSMTEPQVRSLLKERSGSRICVRYCHDDAGKIRFARPAPPPTTTCSSPGRFAWAGAMVVAAAMAACTPHHRDDTPSRTAPEEPSLLDTQVVGLIPFEPVETIEPEPVPSKGEIVAIEPPPEPEPEFERLGDMAVEPTPEPEPVRVTKGNLAAPGTLDEPCDGPGK